MSAAAAFGSALDALWQGALLCGVAAIGLRFAPRSSATTRSAVWSAVLVACLAAVLVSAATRLARPAVVIPTAASIDATSDVARSTSVSIAHAATSDASVIRPPAPSLFEGIAAFAPRIVSPIVAFLFLVAAARCFGLTFELLRVLRARRFVTRIDAPFDDLPAVRRRYAFALSAGSGTPHVLGFGRPLIVLPPALLVQPRDRLRGVVLHELAHVRRYDDVRGALEAVLAAVMWWDPGVRFALARIARLREHICDDAAVEATRDRLGYATALASIARGAVATPAAVPCFSRAGTMLERVRAVLDASVDRTARPDRRLVAGAIVVSAILVLTSARVHAPVLADPVSAPQPSSPADHDNDVHIHIRTWGIAVQPAVFQGTWTLARCAAADRLRLGMAFAAQALTGSETWDQTACVPDSEFRGISVAALANASGDASFSIVRSAGRFDATGHFGGGSGSGTYTFAPSAAFVARLRALGNDTPTNDQLFALTMADFQTTELDALAAHGYAAPKTEELVRLAYMDANPTFVFAAVKLPAATKTLSELVRLGEVGARADYIADVESFGYHPTLEQFIRLAEIGIRPPYIARLRAGGYTDTNVDHLIALRVGG